MLNLNHVLFPGKKQNLKIIQISQAPSNNVHKNLKPFTEINGKTLKYVWYKILDDEFYYIDNFYNSVWITKVITICKDTFVIWKDKKESLSPNIFVLIVDNICLNHCISIKKLAKLI